jgi:membrane protein YqaA with SNARE-associated domain
MGAGGGMSGQYLIEFLVSTAYGVLSAVIPIFNSEVYIVASQVGGLAEETTTAVGCALGQAIGKAGIVVALRRGVKSRWVDKLRNRSKKTDGKPPSRLRRWSDRLLGLLGESRWGVAIVFLSACLYIPPLYAVTLAVADTSRSVIAFGIAVFLGRMLLFLAIAFGISSLIH